MLERDDDIIETLKMVSGNRNLRLGMPEGFVTSETRVTRRPLLRPDSNLSVGQTQLPPPVEVCVWDGGMGRGEKGRGG